MRKDKGVGNNVEPRKIDDENITSAIATSDEELLFICEQTTANLASAECTWVIDAKDPRVEWACLEDESDNHGVSKGHAVACQTAKDILC